jgi:DMSO/TMAO reductase YedYZ molybdopterin-dependent catalytic subunit
MVHSYGGYTTNVSLEDLDREENLFAHTHDGEPLMREHGWPLRLVIPHLYFWKSAKWVRGLNFMSKDQPLCYDRREMTRFAVHAAGQQPG